jgi:hypothetical protein
MIERRELPARFSGTVEAQHDGSNCERCPHAHEFHGEASPRSERGLVACRQIAGAAIYILEERN